MQGMETTVDIKVKMQDGEAEFKQLPSNAQIANSGTLVVSESREAMRSEDEALLKMSRDVLASKDYHEKVVASCEKIRGVLNTQIAKENAQEERIGNLEADVSGMKGTLDNSESMRQKVLNKKTSASEKHKDYVYDRDQRRQARRACGERREDAAVRRQGDVMS